MSYFLPYIDTSGLHIPTYTDIRDNIIDEAKNIFGQDVYLAEDSADYQLISVLSLKCYDAMQAVQLAYNNRNPQSAIGSGLDGIITLNGLKRKPASSSTCVVVLTGIVGTIITAGQVKDNAGYIWSLPDSVTIGAGGTVETTATCLTLGAIEAAIGEITKINTPTSGWLAVENLVQAIVGQVVENDTNLRTRQAISVALPSQTLLDGTRAGILTVANVTRLALYENDTSAVIYETADGIANPEGFPAHSITVVVEGGIDADIAQQIYLRKGIGGYTNGTTAVDIIDSSGHTNTIRFYRPSYQDIYIALTLKKLSGWQPALEALIKQDLIDYLNSLAIGENVSITSLWGVVLNRMPDLKNPIFSVTSLTAGKTVETLGSSDIVIPFSTTAQTTSIKVVLTLTT